MIGNAHPSALGGAAQRNGGNDGGGFDTGKILELVERGLIQGDDVGLVRIFRGGEGKLESERARRIESGIDAQQMQKGLGEERGGDDQDQGERDFGDEQRVAEFGVGVTFAGALAPCF